MTLAPFWRVDGLFWINVPVRPFWFVTLGRKVRTETCTLYGRGTLIFIKSITFLYMMPLVLAGFLSAAYMHIGGKPKAGG